MVLTCLGGLITHKTTFLGIFEDLEILTNFWNFEKFITSAKFIYCKRSWGPLTLYFFEKSLSLGMRCPFELKFYSQAYLSL